jgi:hypothetical protein
MKAGDIINNNKEDYMKLKLVTEQHGGGVGSNRRGVIGN